MNLNHDYNRIDRTVNGGNKPISYRGDKSISYRGKDQYHLGQHSAVTNHDHLIIVCKSRPPTQQHITSIYLF